MDGGETTFAVVPWGAGLKDELYAGTLRVSGHEVFVSTTDSPPYLLAAPTPYQAQLDSFTFDVDEGGVYAQLDGGLMRLAVP